MMKRISWCVLVLFCLIGVATPATAYFEKSNLVLVIYQPDNNEVAIDLGDVANMDFSQQQTLAPSGALDISDVGDGLSWPEIHAGLFTAFRANPAISSSMQFYFATIRDTPPLVNLNSRTNFLSGSDTLHTYYSSSAANIFIGTAKGNMPPNGYLNKLCFDGTWPGIMAGFNGDEGRDADPDLAVLADAGYIDMYLYHWDAYGNILPGNGAEYLAVIRVHADGSVELVPPAPNAAPVLDPVEGQHVEAGDILSLTLSASDADGDVLTFGAEGLPSGTSFDTSLGVFTWTPGPNQAGDYTVTFSVSDGKTSDSETIEIQVTGGNEPPVFNNTDLPDAEEGGAYAFAFSAEDPNGDPLTFTAVNLPSGANLASDGEFTWTPTYDQAGEFAFTVVVSDGTVSAHQNVSLIVQNVNRAPMLNPIGDGVVDESDSLSIDIQAVDPDGDALSLTADYEDPGSPTPALTGPTVQEAVHTWNLSWTPDYSQAGAYGFTFTISDPHGASAAETVTVTVNNVNRPPVLDTLASQSAPLNALMTFTLSGGDPDDGDTVTYYADALPAGATLEETSGLFSWTPDVSGNYPVDFYIRDSLGLQGNTIRVNIHVGDANIPPALTDVGARQAIEGASLAMILSATDPDTNQILTYGVAFPTNMPAGHNAAIDPQSGLFTWTPQGGSEGIYSLVFSVTDNGTPAESDSETVQITVAPNARPGAPSVHSPEDGARIATDSVLLIVNNAAHDPDRTYGQALTYQFQIAATAAMTSILEEVDMVQEGAGGAGGQTQWAVPRVLKENTAYYWRARANDGLASGDWSETAEFFVNTQNDPPGTPVLNMPFDGATLTTQIPVLRIVNSENADADGLEYNFEIWDDAGIVSIADISETEPQTEWALDELLADNATYSWRVRAKEADTEDGYTSGWTDYRTFTVNTANDAPLQPDIASPADEAEIQNLSPMLIIEHQGDPDPEETPVYYFEGVEMIGGVCDFEDDSLVIQSPAIPQGQLEEALPGGDAWQPGDGEAVALPQNDGLPTDTELPGGDDWTPVDGSGTTLPHSDVYTSWRPTSALRDNTRYCWRVRGCDDHQSCGDWTMSYQGNGQEKPTEFFINLANDAPPTPSLDSPENGGTITDTLSPVLKIHTVTDVDGDEVFYEFRLYDAEDNEIAAVDGVQADVQGETVQWAPGELLDNSTYSWEFRAYDAHAYDTGAFDETCASPWSSRKQFTIRINDMPPAPVVNSPVMGGVVGSLSPALSVINAEDPDGDALQYEFELYNDPNFAEYTFIDSAVVQEGNTITSWTPSVQLKDDVTYYWRVRAKDQEFYSSWTATSRFKVDTTYTDLDIKVEKAERIYADYSGIQEISVDNPASPIFGVKVSVPGGAVNADVTITIGYAGNPPAFPGGFQGVGRVIEFGPTGIQFNEEVTVTIPYSDQDLVTAGIEDPRNLDILQYDDDSGEWVQLDISGVDTTRKTISFHTRHFSMYSMAAGTAGGTEIPAVAAASGSGSSGCFITVCNGGSADLPAMMMLGLLLSALLIGRRKSR